MLVAARTDTCTDLELPEYEVHDDHRYKEKGRENIARSRMLFCRAGFKQNIGHCGKEIVVCGVHGHNRTMKCEWHNVLEQFWTRLAEKVKLYDVKFLAGDFNMALTQVVPQLKQRGLDVNCCAWYPWRHKTTQTHNQHLGFDSCGISTSEARWTPARRGACAISRP